MPTAAALVLLLLLPADASFSGGGSPPWPARKRRAVENSRCLGVRGQELVADMFEWEHARAAWYERAGECEYWADHRIHNFGNLGWRGWVHALVVPLATHMIDRYAYGGVDARLQIHEAEFGAEDDVVDLCCGVGFSSARNGRVVAVDTSRPMLGVAKLRRPDVLRFEEGNAENWGQAGCCDISTVMFGMHEMPQDARRRVLRNALRIARNKALVVDIWPGFEPTPMMLSGEPFVLEYLANIDDDVASSFNPMEWEVAAVDVVEQHVRMWKFERLEWGI